MPRGAQFRDRMKRRNPQTSRPRMPSSGPSPKAACAASDTYTSKASMSAMGSQQNHEPRAAGLKLRSRCRSRCGHVNSGFHEPGQLGQILRSADRPPVQGLLARAFFVGASRRCGCTNCRGLPNSWQTFRTISATPSQAVKSVPRSRAFDGPVSAVTTEEFNPESSDLDFLVELDPDSQGSPARRWSLLAAARWPNGLGQRNGQIEVQCALMACS